MDPANPTSPAEPVTDAEFARLMAACPQASAARELCVGVSGGADSMALCLLADAWARARGVRLAALTVDHGLRPEAAGEARRVAAWLAARRVRHEILRAGGPRPSAGLQRAARERRLALLDGSRRDRGAARVLLAHAAEDQAETCLMRAMADSGPDGLAAMAAEARVGGVPLSRPLLPVPRSRLAATCRTRGQDWIEDPSNFDPAFARARLRALAPALEEAGIGTARALRLAAAMGVARRAIDRECARFLDAHGAVSPLGWVRLDGAAFDALPDAFAGPLLSRVLRAVGGAARPARRARVARLRAALREARGPLVRTLGGCVVRRRADGRIDIAREPAAVAGPLDLAPGRATRWDNRFEATWCGPGPARIEAAGAAGLRPFARAGAAAGAPPGLSDAPREALLSLPVPRELDGAVSIPHFVSGGGARRAGSGRRLDIAWCPDQDWIGELAARAGGYGRPAAAASGDFQ